MKEQCAGAKIAYFPFYELENQYTVRFRECLSAFGTVSELPGLRRLFFDLFRPGSSRFDVAFFNWKENDMVRIEDGSCSLRKVAKLFLSVILYRLFVKQLVFIRHNNYPHATRESDIGMAKRVVNWFEFFFDVVLVHSGHQSEGRRHYCPHPLYRKEAVLPEPVAVFSALPREYYIVFGRILPYKKIEQLIEAFPENKNLLIVGSVGDVAYTERITALQRDNVKVLPGFLEEPVAQSLIRHSSGVVISHADRDVLVSGTFFYAMSLGCRVLAVETPFLSWVKPRIGSALLHTEASVKALCRAIRDDDPSVVISQREIDAVGREFCDAAVRSALAVVFR